MGIEELAGDFYDRRTGPGNEFKDLSCADNRQFPSKSGAPSTDVTLQGLTDTHLLVTSAGFFAATMGGTAVTYDANYGTKATNLAQGTVYYLYKTSVANTFVVFDTYHRATLTYADADGTAAKAATGAIDVKAGAAASEAHTFTEFNVGGCAEQSLITSNVVSRTANTDIYNGQQYQLWDAGKIQGCKCDLGYDGPDCSHRISPHGDDPLTTVKSNMMKQAVKIYGKSSATFIREQFLMVYHDPYGGIWRTDAIDGTTNDNIAASRVQDALRALPNEVLEGVKVTGTASTPSTTASSTSPPSRTSTSATTKTPSTPPTSASTPTPALPSPTTTWTSPLSSPTSLARAVSSTSSRSTCPSVALAPSPCPAASPAPPPTPLARSTTTPTSATSLSSLSAPTAASTTAMASASASTASAASPAGSRRPSFKCAYYKS